MDKNDELIIRTYVEEYEREGNGSRVHQTRLLLDEIDRLRKEIESLNQSVTAGAVPHG
jgi:hypothetical protein